MDNMAEPVEELWRYFSSGGWIAATPNPMGALSTLAASAHPRDPPTIVNNSRKNTPVVIFHFKYLELNYWVKRMHILRL